MFHGCFDTLKSYFLLKRFNYFLFLINGSEYKVFNGEVSLDDFS